MHVWLMTEKIDADIKHEITDILGAAGIAFVCWGALMFTRVDSTSRLRPGEGLERKL
jgi:hypothetical protein